MQGDEGRPSRAEVRYHEATEDGLFDARPFPQLWVTTWELRQWPELRTAHPELSSTDISKRVLAEDIPSTLLQELQPTTELSIGIYQ